MLKGREKFFAGRKPSSKMTLKTKSTSVVDAALILVKKRVTDKYFEKEIDFKPKSSSVTGTV